MQALLGKQNIVTYLSLTEFFGKHLYNILVRKLPGCDAQLVSDIYFLAFTARTPPWRSQQAVRQMLQCKLVRSVKLRLNYKVKMICFNKSMHRQLKKTTGVHHLISSFVYNGVFTFWPKFPLHNLSLIYIYYITPTSKFSLFFSIYD